MESEGERSVKDGRAAGFKLRGGARSRLVWQRHCTAYLECDDEPPTRSNEVTSATRQQLDIIPSCSQSAAAAARRRAHAASPNVYAGEE